MSSSPSEEWPYRRSVSNERDGASYAGPELGLRIDTDVVEEGCREVVGAEASVNEL